MNDSTSPSTSLRQRFFPLIWALLLPFRIYLRYFPIQRGKGLVLRHGVLPWLPPVDMEYELPLPANGSIRLRYRETLGLSSLLYGTFENAELEFASRYLKPGDWAFDIGANVGVFSVVFGRATAKNGRVLAFEPVPANVTRLKRNLELNQLKHVQVHPIALGKSEAELKIHLAEDAAYHSFGPVEKPFRATQVLPVRVRKLDDVWRELGRPKVAFLKIDVEGAEDEVLAGGLECLANCQPVVMIEANTPEHLSRLQKRFSALDFVRFKPTTFVAHNYLFHPAGLAEKILAALQ